MTQQVAINRPMRRKLRKLTQRKRCLYRRCGKTWVTPLVRRLADGKIQHGTQCYACGRKMWGAPE